MGGPGHGVAGRRDLGRRRRPQERPQDPPSGLVHTIGRDAAGFDEVSEMGGEVHPERHLDVDARVRG